MEKTEKLEKYHLVRLPNEQWRQYGEGLVLAESVKRDVLRFGEWRLCYRGSGYGLLLLEGPPGVGKSDTARFAVDAAVRKVGSPGNGLVVHMPSLFDENLGRGPKLVAELMETIALSASRRPTGVILEDAEGLFVSRQQSVASRDPTDVLRMTAALLSGLDSLREVTNVLIYATCNFAGVLDEAIVSRCDHVVRFELPTLAERRAILAAAVNGVASGWLLDTLAAATEGKSGRDLVRITQQAFLCGTGSPEELTAADFLRAVGLTPEPIPSVEEVTFEATATEAIGQEEAICPDTSPNGSLQEAYPPRNKLSRLWRWFEKPLTA
jgi:SpoVK/Ycf46/Vps4 family AAA+-type ATPase